MLQRRAMKCVVVLACLLVCSQQTASAELIYSKSPRFKIPFQFDGSELKRMNAREFLLFVSTDAEQWEKADTAALTETKFSYTAPGDGSYWFSVQTVTATGQTYPTGPHTPSLNVCVDTTPPSIELTLIEVEPGRIQLAWNVNDAHLQPESLQLEFKDPKSPSWRPVNAKNELRGRTVWSANGSGPVKVRGRILDLAGNSTQSSAELVIGERLPVAEIKTSQPLTPVVSEVPATAPIESLIVSPLTPPPRLIPPAQSQVAGPLSQLSVPQSPSNLPLPVESASDLLSIAPPVSQPAMPDRVDLALPVQTASPAFSHSQRKLNSLQFRIGYSLQEIGPSGVSKVDLFITEDGGRQWYHYGVDYDRLSPMEISVPHDGEYGFCFRVTNGLGRVDIPPQPGNSPEVTVTVDRVPPVARLYPVTFANSSDFIQAAITWTAQDRELSDRPIALLYSTSPSGPWTPIGDWQANTGKFLWVIPAELDSAVFIRMDARDAAGNIVQVVGETPFIIDRSQPRARITNIESLTATRQ